MTWLVSQVPTIADMVVRILGARGVKAKAANSTDGGTKHAGDQLWVEAKVGCRHFENSRRRQMMVLESLRGRQFKGAGLMRSLVERARDP